MKKKVNSKEKARQGDRETEPKGFSITEQSHRFIRVEYCRFAIYKCKNSQ